jgi:hypothetical protein
MASRSTEPREAVTRATRNVCSDLGLPDAAERRLGRKAGRDIYNYPDPSLNVRVGLSETPSAI